MINKVLKTGISQSDGLKTKFQLKKVEKTFIIEMREGYSWLPVYTSQDKSTIERYFKTATS